MGYSGQAPGLFVLDTSIEYGVHMSKLINDLHIAEDVSDEAEAEPVEMVAANDGGAFFNIPSVKKVLDVFVNQVAMHALYALSTAHVINPWLLNRMVNELRGIPEENLAQPPKHLNHEEENQKYKHYVDQIKAILSPKERITFQYMIDNDCDAHRAAQEFNTNVVNVRVRWCRIRKKIEQMLPNIFSN